MFKKLKKFFSPIQSKTQQRGAIFIPFLIATGIAGLLSVVGWLTGLELFEKIGYFWFTLFFNIVATITTAFASLSALILQYVLSSDFTTLSYTSKTNPIIDAGLSVTQGFVNMLLVLILVFIGLATILRLAGYETKKLLPTFIIVALLVNFAPVICGLIIDATNIVMNYFVKDLYQFASFPQKLGDLWSNLGSAIWGDKEEFQNACFYALTVSVFSFFLGLAFLLFAVIFLVRYVAIWTLVILSPLAFACYILPITKKYWNIWWNQFLQWSFIGITAGFFLYLATLLIGKIDFLFEAPKATGLPGGMSLLLIYMVPLVFLYIGLIVGLATSAFGASTVIGLTKKYGKKGAIYGAAGAGALAGRAISSDWAEKRGVKEKLTKQATAPLPGFRGKSFLGKVATGAGYATGAIPTYWALRRGVGEASLRITETGAGNVKAAKDKYKGTTPERKVSGFREPRMTSSDKIGALTQAIEEKQLNDFKKSLGKTYEGGVRRELGPSATVKQIEEGVNKKVNEEITNVGKAALRIHPDILKKIRNAFPGLAEEIGGGFSTSVKETADLTFKNAAEAAQYNNSIATKITAKLKPADIPEMDENSLYTTDARRAIHSFWTGSHVSAAGQAFGKKFIDDFQGAADKLGKGWYEKNNSRLGTYLASSTARGLGIGFHEEKKPSSSP